MMIDAPLSIIAVSTHVCRLFSLLQMHIILYTVHWFTGRPWPGGQPTRLILPSEFRGIPLNSFLLDFKGTESGFPFRGTQKGT